MNLSRNIQKISEAMMGNPSPHPMKPTPKSPSLAIVLNNCRVTTFKLLVVFITVQI